MRIVPLAAGLALTVLAPSLPAAPAPVPEAATLAREIADTRELLRLAQATPGAADRLAGFEARLQRLEEELRRLTGRLEELEYRQRRLEQATAAGASGTAGASAPPAPVADAATPGEAPSEAPAAAPKEAGRPAAAAAPTERVEAPAAPLPEPDAAAKKGYVLGTLPADALRERPAAAGESGASAGASPEERYEAALALLEAGNFDAAEKAFSRFLEDFPDHPKAASAAFWLGETFFFRQDYATAASVYARNYRTYGPEAPRAPDTLLKLGMALAAIGDRERACQTFAELERRYPRAPAPVRQALERERTAVGCS
ncbi:MAG TPA: tol-pal system protein YbgF [Rhodospirillales bacterium]|nr:tol-pal system protein YbgF [Rhodospirillales bacterium]